MLVPIPIGSNIWDVGTAEVTKTIVVMDMSVFPLNVNLPLVK